MALSAEKIRLDARRYTQEADGYLRNKYPNLFPTGGDISNFGHNDAIDAFRHAYVSGRFAQEYGLKQSFLFGTYHELTHWNDNPERHMDFWNNSKGIEYSKDAKTPKDLGDRINKGIKDGELTTEPGKPPTQESDYRSSDSVNSNGSGAGGVGDGGAAGGIGTGGALAAAGGTTPPRRDPLVLDLDGDGVETTSTRDGTVVLFDHDGDGVKTGTGWVKPDDGWLVLDRNGNGSIDSGRELFGVDTMKSNSQLASNGFDALKDLDANSDGRIDAADSVFANLRIWRDLNQDGISQADELSTLGANNIVSIGVNAKTVSTDLGNGNIQSAAGTFTRANGSS